MRARCASASVGDGKGAQSPTQSLISTEEIFQRQVIVGDEYIRQIRETHWQQIPEAPREVTLGQHFDVGVQFPHNFASCS
jgi:hypothetical protein